MSEQTSYYPELAKEILPAEGRLGVLLPGLGAVATTFIAGTLLAVKGLARPFGSITQMQRIRLGKRTNWRRWSNLYLAVGIFLVRIAIKLQSDPESCLRTFLSP